MKDTLSPRGLALKALGDLKIVRVRLLLLERQVAELSRLVPGSPPFEPPAELLGKSGVPVGEPEKHE